MQYNQTRQLAEDVARELGEGWAVDREFDGHGEMIDHADGRRLHFYVQGYESDKISISGAYPYPTEHKFEKGDHNAIAVSISRGAKVVAAEIKRRLMPRYVEVLAKVNERNAKTASDFDKRQARVSEVYAAMGQKMPSRSERTLDEERRRGQSRVSLCGMPEGYGDVEIGHDGSHISIEIRYIPAERALALLRQLAAGE